MTFWRITSGLSRASLLAQLNLCILGLQERKAHQLLTVTDRLTDILLLGKRRVKGEKPLHSSLRRNWIEVAEFSCFKKGILFGALMSGIDLFSKNLLQIAFAILAKQI